MATPNLTKKKLFDGSIDLANDTLKVALYNDSTGFSFDPDTHEFVNDVLDGGTTAQEFGNGSGTGYSRQSVANQSTSQDNTDDEAVFDGDDVTFSGLDGATIQGIIVYRQVGGNDTTPGDDEIIDLLDDSNVSDLPLTTNGSDVTISWDSEGILNLA